MTDALETAAPAGAIIHDRLQDYADRISFEKGKRPDPLLTDTERGDLATAEVDWGVPRGVLLLIDRLMTMISPAARVDFVRALRAAAPERNDQTDVVGAFILWLLVDPVHGARTVVRNPDVDAAITAVVDAQRRTLAGAALTRAEWSAVRKAATTDSDPMRDGRASHFAAMCAEAAAWPPATSPSAGVQTLEPWANITDGIVNAEQDWTLADYDTLQTLMQTVWDVTAAARAAGEQPDLDAMMHAEAPDLAVRWERHIVRARELSATRMAAACAALVGFLKGPQA